MDFEIIKNGVNSYNILCKANLVNIIKIAEDLGIKCKIVKMGDELGLAINLEDMLKTNTVILVKPDGFDGMVVSCKEDIKLPSNPSFVNYVDGLEEGVYILSNNLAPVDPIFVCGSFKDIEYILNICHPSALQYTLSGLYSTVEVDKLISRLEEEIASFKKDLCPAGKSINCKNLECERIIKMFNEKERALRGDSNFYIITMELNDLKKKIIDRICRETSIHKQ